MLCVLGKTLYQQGELRQAQAVLEQSLVLVADVEWGVQLQSGGGSGGV